MNIERLPYVTILIGSLLPFPAYALEPAGQVAAPVTVADDGTIIVTGSRMKRSLSESPSPIDIISAEQLDALGGNSGQLRDALSVAIPSFKVDTSSNLSWSSVQRPAGLRGFSGAHVLVLVNGKRRHNTAEPSGGVQAVNANPVDLDMIPPSAIDHIEVLRDGAAAVYGSDAIAGVINIILKSSPTGGSASTLVGQRYDYPDQNSKNGGRTFQADLDHGFALGSNGGSINIALHALDQAYTFRQGLATQLVYPLINGQPDPREATINKRLYRGGLPKIKSIAGSYNAILPVGDITLYSFATMAYRDAWNGQSYRFPSTTSTLPEIGILQPTGHYPEFDYQFTAGGKGEIKGWSWDLSGSVGRDRADNGEEDTLNPSLGPTSPRNFETFLATFTQASANLDVSRPIDIGLDKPLNFAFGFEFRHEAYRTHLGDAAAYINGGYVFPSGPFAGQLAAIGVQGGVTVLPGDQANIKRNNAAAYIDFDLAPLRHLELGFSGRYEHFDDSAGDTISGRFTSRYAITPKLAISGTVSNGFRAPSLSQQGFAFGANGFTVVNGAVAFIQQRVAAPDSALAKALGATPLKPERSFNLSAALTYNPTSKLNFTLDVYQIDLKHRIAQTSYLQGAGVNAILTAAGLPSGQVVSYLTNAIDTRTSGVDVTGNYRMPITDNASIRWSLGFNYNDTKITNVAANPAVLASSALVLFDRASRGNLTDYNPKTKLILGGLLNYGALSVNVTEQRYGKVALLSNTVALDQHYGARWLTDLDIGYDVTRTFQIGVGANNLFNTYPDHSTIPDTTGNQLYAQNSPFGFFGGFYYVRARVRF